MCQVSGVRCHVSCVMCHVSCVRCQVRVGEWESERVGSVRSVRASGGAPSRSRLCSEDLQTHHRIPPSERIGGRFPGRRVRQPLAIRYEEAFVPPWAQLQVAYPTVISQRHQRGAFGLPFVERARYAHAFCAGSHQHERDFVGFWTFRFRFVVGGGHRCGGWN